jgi:hypothetical protein
LIKISANLKPITSRTIINIKIKQKRLVAVCPFNYLKMTIRLMDQIDNFNSEISFKPIKSWYQLER